MWDHQFPSAGKSHRSDQQGLHPPLSLQGLWRLVTWSLIPGFEAPSFTFQQ